MWRKAEINGRHTEQPVHEEECILTYLPGNLGRSCGSIMTLFLNKVLGRSVPGGFKGCQQLASPRPPYPASSACLRGNRGCHTYSFQILEQSVGRISLWLFLPQWLLHPQQRPWTAQSVSMRAISLERRLSSLEVSNSSHRNDLANPPMKRVGSSGLGQAYVRTLVSAG